MKKSVSRVITPDNGNLNARVGRNYDSIGTWEVVRSFGKIPKNKYRVTYTLNEKGKYLVSAEEGWIPGLVDPWVGICFLPREWHEMRVSRKVEILPKRRVK